jgi:hypothetical protein
MDTFSDTKHETHHLKFFLHFSSDVHRFFSNLLYGEDTALVNSYLGVNRGVPEIGVRVRTEGHLARPYQRLYRLSIEKQQSWKMPL